MTTTPHGQVPAIQRYKIGYHSDEWGVRDSTPSGIPDHRGAWVLYKDHVAALAKAQQPTHAQAGATYTDRTPQLNVGDSAFESWYSAYNPAHKADKQRARDAYAAGMGDPLVTASPAPQADSQPAPVLGTIAHVGTGKTTLTGAITSALRAASTEADNVTAPAGATSNTHWNQAPCAHCGCTEGQHFITRCHHIQGETRYTPTQQADSQPASVLTSETGGDWTQPTTIALRLGDAMQLLCGGKRPPDDMVQQWLDNTSESLQEFAASNGPAWAQGIGLIDAALVMVDQPTEITAIDNPDRDHEHRAARAPADSVTAPASGATGKNLLQVQAWVIPDGNGGGQFSWQKQDERFWIRLTPPAQTADSVTAPVGVVVVTDDMVLAALRAQYPAAYGQYLRHPANGPKTSLRTESEIDTARRMIVAALSAAPIPPTHAADSVLEDAARYRWLREGNDAKHGAAWHVAVNLYGCEWDAAIDSARKQGANHEQR